MKSRFVRLSLLATLSFTPMVAWAQLPSIDGLRVWLDASDGSTISTSGGKVTQWDDKSGFGNHAVQPVTDRQPSYEAASMNGQPAIRFDALGTDPFGTSPTDDGMLINPTGFSLNRGYTVYLVDQYSGGKFGRTLTNADSTSNWLLGHWNGNEAHYTGAFIGPNVAVATNVPLISEGVGGTSFSSTMRNGRPVGYGGTLAVPGRIGLGDDDGITWSESSTADVSELVVFQRVLTDTERWGVTDYLQSKYGVGQQASRAYSTYSTVFNGGDAGDGLDFQGTFVAAVNAGGPAGATVGNAVFTSDTGITAENTIPNWFGATLGGGGATANDTGLNQVLQSIRWTAVNGSGQETVDIAVPGLTPGHAYKVQLMFAEGGPGSTRHFGVEAEGSRIFGDFNEGQTRGIDNPTGMSSAIVHSFVAGDNTLNMALTAAGLAGGDLNPIISGYTVEDLGTKGVVTTSVAHQAADLDFKGNFTYAVTMSGTAGQVVGDATFTTVNTAGVKVNAENFIQDWTVTNLGAGADDVALASAVGSIRWSETNDRLDGVAVDLNVTPGDVYKLQLMFVEGCCDRGFDVNFEGILTVDNYSPNAQGGSLALNGVAAITYEFTAEDSVFNITLDGFGTAFTDRNPILNGFTLERIPEPATGALSLLALGAVVRRRRRA